MNFYEKYREKRYQASNMWVDIPLYRCTRWDVTERPPVSQAPFKEQLKEWCIREHHVWSSEIN